LRENLSEGKNPVENSVHDYYCIDTSALIKMGATYPPHIFPGLWQKLDDLVAADRLIAPKAVRQEFTPYAKFLKDWVKRNRKMFKKHTAEQLKIVADITRKFPGLTDSNRETEQADPFVIALAAEAKRNNLFERYVVVTMEKIKGRKVKIPFVCEKYGIECIDVIEFFEREGWEF